MTVRRLLAVVAWALLVLVCSTGVWGVIRTAGTELTASPDIPSMTTGAAPSSPGRATTTGPKPASPVETDGSGTQHTQRPTQRPTPEHTEGHTQGPTEVRRTWQGTAGAVVATCGGDTITFRGAQPNSGWRVEVGNRGPEDIEIRFTRFQSDDAGDDAGVSEVGVRARCVGGEPRFSSSGD